MGVIRVCGTAGFEKIRRGIRNSSNFLAGQRNSPPYRTRIFSIMISTEETGARARGTSMESGHEHGIRARAWNSIPQSIKDARSVVAFKKKTENSFFELKKKNSNTRIHGRAVSRVS